MLYIVHRVHFDVAETYYRETINSLAIRRRQNRATGSASVAGDGRASEYESTLGQCKTGKVSGSW
jgi:hypothetical protein